MFLDDGVGNPQAPTDKVFKMIKVIKTIAPVTWSTKPLGVVEISKHR